MDNQENQELYSALIGYMDKKFLMIEERLNQHDLKFAGIDQNFLNIEDRFNRVDQRIDKFDNRLIKVENCLIKVENVLINIDGRLSGLEALFKQNILRFNIIDGSLEQLNSRFVISESVMYEILKYVKKDPEQEDGESVEPVRPSRFLEDFKKWLESRTKTNDSTTKK